MCCSDVQCYQYVILSHVLFTLDNILTDFGEIELSDVANVRSNFLLIS